MTTIPTHKKYFLIVGAVLAWVAVMLQNRMAPIPETTVRFFSFFTILTNTLVAIYCSLALVNSNSSFYIVIGKIIGKAKIKHVLHEK